MADKYVKQDSGLLKEVEAADASTGVANAGDIVALDAQGKLDNSLLPSGIGADTLVVPATENLSAGDLVNMYDASGTASVRKADATSVGKEAVGFVLDAVTSGANATVYFEGTNDQVAGLSIGLQFLDTTAGGMTGTAPAATGNIVQRVGFAAGATVMNVECSQPIELA